MGHKKSFGQRLTIVLGASLAFSLGVAIAQSPASTLSARSQLSRLAGDWRSSAAVAVPLSQPPAASLDLGTVPSTTRLERMLLLLAPSADQQAALTAELANQQNSASSEYHHWLTPADFAAAYANSAADVATVSAWLQAEGFQVAPLPASRGWIEFSGTAAQVEQAFHAQVHFVTTLQGTRAALASGIRVPSALLPLIHGLVSLDGSLSTAALTTPRPVATAAADLASQTSLNSAEALTPQLVAQLLHLDALHTSGVRGAGETIAIPARSNVRAADIAAFRSTFSLPASALTVLPNGSDPGRTADEAEAALTASWAGAAAPGAQIVLVPAATTAATDGLDLALASIVDQALAHTVSVGYSACEASLGEAHQAFYSALYQQATAEGVAVIAAVGDSGPSACQAAGSDTPVTTGYAVNALASTPWNTAAGVASFGSGGAGAGASALSAWSPAGPADPAYAGGGGKSASYAAPAWQPAPAASAAETASASSTNHRLLPDLALPTALDSAVNRGLAFCLSGSTASSSCTLVRSGGSSASAAIFAGIAALVAEKHGPQGNLAPTLYTVSRQSGIFSDVAQGSAQLSCQASTPGCDSSGQIGFTAVAGYDLASGLGVVNAQKLLKAWPEAAAGTGAASVTWTTISQTIGSSASLTLSVTVSSATATSTTVPTGTVVFYDVTNSANLGTATLSSGVATATIATGTFATGVHEIEAIYSGDSVYATETSAQIAITVKNSVTVVLTSNITTASPEQSVVLTATVMPIVDSTSETNPLGTVIFYSGSTVIGSSALVASVGFGSVATLTTSTLTAGTDTVYAVYQGDTYYANATSNTLTLTIQDFTITPSPTNPATDLTIVKGSSGSASFDVTGLGGFNNEIQVVCAVPSQDDMTCTATPQQLIPNGTVTFVVQTFSSGSTTALHRVPRPFWPRAAGGTALALLAGFFLLPFGRRARVFTGTSTRRLFIFLLLLVGLGGAGIGCSSSTISQSASGGTPLGVATLKITATAYVDNAVVARSVYLTVNVVASGSTTTN
jgi:hypothetical protein